MGIGEYRMLRRACAYAPSDQTLDIYPHWKRQHWLSDEAFAHVDKYQNKYQNLIHAFGPNFDEKKCN